MHQTKCLRNRKSWQKSAIRTHTSTHRLPNGMLIGCIVTHYYEQFRQITLMSNFKCVLPYYCCCCCRYSSFFVFYTTVAIQKFIDCTYVYCLQTCCVHGYICSLIRVYQCPHISFFRKYHVWDDRLQTQTHFMLYERRAWDAHEKNGEKIFCGR